MVPYGLFVVRPGTGFVTLSSDPFKWSQVNRKKIIEYMVNRANRCENASCEPVAIYCDVPSVTCPEPQFDFVPHYHLACPRCGKVFITMNYVEE